MLARMLIDGISSWRSFGLTTKTPAQFCDPSASQLFMVGNIT